MIKVTPETPPEAVSRLWSLIIQTHSVFIGILIGGIFTTERRYGRIQSSVAALSILLSLVWIALILTSWIGYPGSFNAGDKGGLIDILTERATLASFLVAGMLAYVSGSKGLDEQAGGSNQ